MLQLHLLIGQPLLQKEATTKVFLTKRGQDFKATDFSRWYVSLLMWVGLFLPPSSFWRFYGIMCPPGILKASMQHNSTLCSGTGAEGEV